MAVDIPFAGHDPGLGRAEKKGRAMDKDEVLKIFRDSRALLEGHFILSSGLHSPVYLQCARVLMDARRAARLCRALKENVEHEIGTDIDLIVSPAMGGVIVGYEMGRQLGVDAVFTERVAGQLELRRGFEIKAGQKVLMVEDIVTTGLSSRECIACIHDLGGNVVGAAALIDRSSGRADVGVPLTALLSLDAPSFEADKIPQALAGIPAQKPGSRGHN